MPLELIDAALRGMVLALALLLAALLLRGRARLHTPAASAALAMSLGLAVQAPSSMPWVEHSLGCALQAPLIAVSVGNAVLFALFCAALLDDAFRWRAWHGLAWVAALLLGAAQCPAVMLLEPGHPLRDTLRVALRLLPLASVVVVLVLTLRHWRADLVEERRRLRGWLMAAGLVYTLVQLAARLSTPTGLLTPGLALLDVALLLVVLAGWALSELTIVPGGLLGAAAVAPAGVGPAPPGPPPKPSPPDERLAAALTQAMEADRAYRDAGLTLATLAQRLGVPEYRLRRHIHGQLGFRNFNAYVNSFRLADARRWLADPTQREAPVLTLALDAGFGSVGPFNRAFKADTGLTPTEFRARALAENGNR